MDQPDLVGTNVSGLGKLFDPAEGVAGALLISRRRHGTSRRRKRQGAALESDHTRLPEGVRVKTLLNVRKGEPAVCQIESRLDLDRPSERCNGIVGLPAQESVHPRVK